jgi:predicted protein tyrosine phosphatase
MTIVVCPLSKVSEMISAHNPERIVSLLDPEFAFPDTGTNYVDRHLKLSFHDIHAPNDSQMMPSESHIAKLLAFLTAWDRTAPILIHCRAGIGRSTAAAYIAACLHNPNADEHDVATPLRQVAPLARPNETLIRLADDAMKRDGKMSSAITDTGRDLPWIFDSVDVGKPFEMTSTFAI